MNERFSAGKPFQKCYGITDPVNLHLSEKWQAVNILLDLERKIAAWESSYPATLKALIVFPLLPL